MGIFGALTTAVSGLQAQSFALENISGNIANSQTTGFKRTDTSFQDLVRSGELGVRRQYSGSVQAFSRQTNDVQGAIQASSSATSVAINGNGFFTVQDANGSSGGVPGFSGQDLFTRRGDFTIDRNGYVVNGAGYYLKGLPVDPATGATTGSSTQVMKLTNDFYPAEATTSINYRANLPTIPQTANYDAADSSSWLLPARFGDTVSADDSASFVANTVSGDSLTVFDDQGVEHDVQFRWGKETNADTTAGTADTWGLYYLSDAAATATETAWAKVDADGATAGTQNYAFSSSGALTSPAGGTVTIPNLTVDGRSLGAVTIEHGSGLTQFASSDGSTTTKTLTQDGVASGSLVGMSIADGGAVNATYTNGKVATIYKIPVVTFNAENQLSPIDGGAYAQTEGSGGPLSGGGGDIVGAALEESNVDIADEFSKMIVTQQAYSANTKVISTANDMMQETLQMLR